MPDVRHTAFAAVTTIVLLGTAYSIKFNTYLDTSNPLLAHLPHPFSQSDYFASKSNFLNVYFIKKAWGWTSGVFLLSWFTSPPNARTKGRMFKWIIQTTAWVLFTIWFFGPALLERAAVASGGECLLTLPSGELVTVPHQLCYTRSTVSLASHPDLFTSSFAALPPGWGAKPRLRRGHDVSGHIFLLTMSILFLADQVRPSLRAGGWSTLHYTSIIANLSLICVWLLASYTTSIYFHSPSEKISGYCSFLLLSLCITRD